MIDILYIVDLLGKLHPFYHWYRGKRLVTYYIFSDPTNHMATPNESLMRWSGIADKSRHPP